MVDLMAAPVTDYTATLVCDHCGETATVPVAGEVEQPVRHTREAVTVSLQFDQAALSKAVAVHISRGCRSPHLRVRPVVTE
ncbi:hypothetical protein PBI_MALAGASYROSE_86 [Mycobacterium phage MalagasyRose]|uniref:Uncharacterized protein n=1 Tax=Mycobacterium phage MalagasyRose TaxID=2599870 RepID=A0A5J6TF22_9CAUD|nr:hypothetical protein QEH39_gp02 [Mycobacterium phage MalagasyRose]QFG08934.1 hypothetical protein PBI_MALAGASYROSE_86 [Mycobacterium phage MalagasyRose]